MSHPDVGQDTLLQIHIGWSLERVISSSTVQLSDIRSSGFDAFFSSAIRTLSYAHPTAPVQFLEPKLVSFSVNNGFVRDVRVTPHQKLLNRTECIQRFNAIGNQLHDAGWVQTAGSFELTPNFFMQLPRYTGKLALSCRSGHDLLTAIVKETQRSNVQGAESFYIIELRFEQSPSPSSP